MKEYIIAIQDQPVFTILDVHKLVAFYQNDDELPSLLDMTICAESKEDFCQNDMPLQKNNK